MTFDELLAKADDEIVYPFEKVIEYYWPTSDTLTDYVCVGAIVLEEVYKQDGIGSEKKQALMDGLITLWASVPIPDTLRPILDHIFQIAMSALIDIVVAWLNELFPNKAKDAAWSIPSGAPKWTQEI